MKNHTAMFLVWLFLGSVLLAETPAADPEGVEESAEEKEWQALSHDVRYQVLHEGDGTKAALWAAVYLHYRLTAANGTILADTYTDPDHGRRAHKHVIGSGTLAEALEMAVTSMRERDRRVFLIPAELFDLYDFHTHNEGDVHNDDEHDTVARALRPGSMIKAEVSLLWVRPYDPTNFNRFRAPSD
jgi:hypothetical protein